MKRFLSVFSVLLVLVLLISSLPMAMAATLPNYTYDNSVLVTYEIEKSVTPVTAQEFCSLLLVDHCIVIDKQTKEEAVVYQLVVMDLDATVEDTIARVKEVEGVTNASRNVYAPDYCEKESYLTLNQTTVEIPVGGVATLKITDAHLVSDEKQETGIMVAVDHYSLPFEQFRSLVREMGNKEIDEEVYFYSFDEKDCQWEKEYLFFSGWGSNEYDRRYDKESSIGKYLIPIDCFSFLTPEQILNRFVEVPQFTDVRLIYDIAPSGIQRHEKWTVGNYDIAAVALEGGDKWNQFYTATVVGKQVGETVITVQHGGGSRICYATCTVKVVENTTTKTDVVWGDVTEDTKVDAKDALEVLKYSVEKTEFTAKQMLAAEVDGDQKINAKDALQILKYSVKKITKFPIEEVVITPTDITPTDQ